MEYDLDRVQCWGSLDDHAVVRGAVGQSGDQRARRTVLAWGVSCVKTQVYLQMKGGRGWWSSKKKVVELEDKRL